MSTDQSEYRIRLPQPWQASTSCVQDPNGADVRITTHEFQRGFQRPTGLNEDSTIHIEVRVPHDLPQLREIACVLNGIDLVCASTGLGYYRFACPSQQLRSTNQLLIRFVSTAEVREVALPIVALIL